MASRETVEAVIKVLLKHLPASTISAIMQDLLKVKGNQSFEATIQALNHAVRELKS